MLVPLTLAAAALISLPISHAGQSDLHSNQYAATESPIDISTWTIDIVHSELTFSVRHLVSRVRGNFTDWKGTITADTADWTKGYVEVTIQAASINTHNQKRDTHLRSADFFDVEKFPTITFKSTRIVRDKDDKDDDDNDIKVYGNLTIRDVTKPVVLDGELNAIKKGPDGKLRAGFDAEVSIDRSDFGVSWNAPLDGGGMILSNKVKISISIAAIKD